MCGDKLLTRTATETPELCSGGSSLAEVVSLGTGVGHFGIRTRLALKPAAVRASLATTTLPMLPATPERCSSASSSR